MARRKIERGPSAQPLYPVAHHTLYLLVMSGHIAGPFPAHAANMMSHRLDGGGHRLGRLSVHLYRQKWCAVDGGEGAAMIAAGNYEPRGRELLKALLCRT